MERALAIAVMCLAGCNFAPGKLGDQPIIDAPPTDVIVTPDSSTCTGTSSECVGDTLRICSGSGATAVDTLCRWGCAMGTPKCLTLTPGGDEATNADTLPMSGLASVMLVGGMTIDTNDGRIGTTTTPDSIRGAGNDVVDGIYFEVRNNAAVFRMHSLRFNQGAGAPLNFVGSDAPVFIADDEIVIEGIIDLHGGTCMTSIAGPGGFDGGIKNVPGENYPNDGAGNGVSTANLGGGGGGYGTAGGNGGNGPAPGSPGPVGGTPFGVAAITNLDGGGGGGGGGGGANAGIGGGGSGGIQLISNTRIRIVSGGINAGGCGGRSGSGGNDGGGGGGAGGAILLEAPIIAIDGALAVNGGGGGGGNTGTTVYAEAGRLDRTPAAGAPATGGATGGAGAAAAITASPGGTQNGKAGGGGGGLGRIRIHTRADTGLTLGSNAMLSPNFTDNGTTCTRAAAALQ